jgi:O-succinylbenzoic acid--CoA ligase
VTRPLAVVDTADPLACLIALRAALAGEGPAVLFRGGGVNPVQTAPLTVEKQIALVVETSGTTGRPKRVALSADAVLASAAATESALGGPGQWLLALPVQYIAGSNVLARSFVAGTTPVLVPPGGLTSARMREAVAAMDNPVKYTALVPAQLSRLVDEAEAEAEAKANTGAETGGDLQSALAGFARILVGGQATPASLIERATALGWNVTRTYGSSETCGGVVYDGIPVGQASVRIVDGRIELGGPTLADYYLSDPERTERTFVEHDGSRWYRTDDAGEFVDGVLRVLGRLDDTIVTGGLKVRLGEVERVVREQAGLSDAVVVAGYHPEWGDVPVVVTTARPALDEVRRAVGAVLTPESRPDRIITVDAVPTLPSGKPDRLAAARLAIANR